MASAFLGNMAGKVVFVTGSSSGIGQATAVEYARLGLKVALHGPIGSNSDLEETVKMCIEAGAKPSDILKTEAQLEDNEQIKAAVEKILAKFGTVHILASVAGAASLGGGLGGTSVQELEQMLQINMKAPFLIAKLLQNHIIQNKGAMVFVSSDSARLPGSSMLAYSTSKAALTHMAKTLALEFAGEGVRVNVVSPCWVRTKVFQHCGFTESEEESEKLIDDNTKYMVCGRIPYPNEIARTLVFLTSDATPYINGQDVVLDGGNILTSLATHAWWLDRNQGEGGGILADLSK